MNNLKKFFNLREDEEKKKKKILLDDEDTNECEVHEQSELDDEIEEDCGACATEYEPIEQSMIEEDDEEILLDDEIGEQNTTAAIAGYNMPLGAGRPSVANQNKLPKDYYKPQDKKAIKSLDSGPNPDRTYKKYKWAFENKKISEQYKPETSTQKKQKENTQKKQKSTITPGKQYYKKNKTKIRQQQKTYRQKNKSHLKNESAKNYLKNLIRQILFEIK